MKTANRKSPPRQGRALGHSAAREPFNTVEVLERPLQLVFGGPDGRTLFIPARTSLYAVRVRHPGR